MPRAVFLDRDGVINELLYLPDLGRIDTPFHADQFHLLPGVARAVRLINAMGLKAVVVSNQPGIARGHFSEEMLARIDAKMKAELAAGGACLDAIYYCRHHPEGTLPDYRRDCGCRKPKPGLLLQAARDLDLDLAGSYMIGDGLTDVQAGRAAGCRTILLGRKKCDLCRWMEDLAVEPDLIVPDLLEAVTKIKSGGP